MIHSFGNISVGYAIEAKDLTPKLIDQVHGGSVVQLDSPPETIPEADGVITHRTNFPLSVFTADCIPLLFFSPSINAPIAAVHCGWRGALAQIAQNTVTLMQKTDLEVVIGPCILSCCFEVKEDLIDAFHQKQEPIDGYLQKRTDGIYFDLVQYVVSRQLQGVKVHRTFLRCTKCSELPSFRRNKSTNPRIRSWIVKSQ